MRRFRILLLCLCFLLSTSPAEAQRINQLPPHPTILAKGGDPEAKIAAVINDDVISTSDMQSRIALSLLSAGLPDTAEIKEKLAPQVLRTLIDEQLQMQEAKRLGISVSTEEVNKAIDNLAQQNRIPGGNMSAFLAQNGVPPETLIRQAQATLLWNKVIARELRPRVDVGDDEIEAAAERIRANVGKQEYLISEIFLAVDTPKDEDQVKAFSDQLIRQINSGGNFAAIARQFSQGTGAANGGDIGWIQDGQLPPELNKPLMQSKTGELIGPVRSTSGFHIIGIRDVRTVTAPPVDETALKLQQAFLPAATGQTPDSLKQEAERLRATATGCDQLPKIAEKDFPKWRVQNLGEIKQERAPAWLAGKTASLAVGQPSEAMVTDKGALVLFVCKRETKTGAGRAMLMTAIGMERLDLLARRSMRDLRRSAYIDVRPAALR